MDENSVVNNENGQFVDDLAGDLSFQRTQKPKIGVKRSYNQSGKKNRIEPSSSQKRAKYDNGSGINSYQNAANNQVSVNITKTNIDLSLQASIDEEILSR